MKKTICIIFVMLMATGIIIPSVGAWSINPAKWTFYMREEPKIVPVYFDMEIKNNADSDITVHLSAIEPEKLYEEEKVNFPGGNTPIPDLSWIHFSESEVIIPANSNKEIPITIDIPDNPENYNQSWEVWVYADQVSSGGNIQVDYKCRWTIQTPIGSNTQSQGIFSDGEGGINPLAIIGVIVAIVLVTSYILYKKDVINISTKKEKKSESEDDIFR